MGGYGHSFLHTVELPDAGDIPPEMPQVFDDHSLAFSLGIRCKTLWWLLLTNNISQLERGEGLYKEYKIPKRGKTNKYRVINEPCPALKNVQKSILVTYFKHLEAPKHMGAYVTGRNLRYTAKQHVGKAVKISLDITDFFPHTRRAWVRDWLRTFGYNDWVVKSLSNLMVIPRRLGDHVVSGLPQGAPTSSLVSNWVANDRLDAPILKFLDTLEQDSVYTRYSDNLEISFDENLPFDYVDNIKAKLINIIHSTGYRVNTRKTDVQRQASPDRSMRVLGMTVNEKVNIPREEYRRLRAIIHNCATKGFGTQYERAGCENGPALYDHLNGKLIYWKQVNENKISPLIDTLKEAALEQEIIQE